MIALALASDCLTSSCVSLSGFLSGCRRTANCAKGNVTMGVNRSQTRERGGKQRETERDRERQREREGGRKGGRHPPPTHTHTHTQTFLYVFLISSCVALGSTPSTSYSVFPDRSMLQSQKPEKNQGKAITRISAASSICKTTPIKTPQARCVCNRGGRTVRETYSLRTLTSNLSAARVCSTWFSRARALLSAALLILARLPLVAGLLFQLRLAG